MVAYRSEETDEGQGRSVRGARYWRATFCAW
jgi:hypothetical protein